MGVAVGGTTVRVGLAVAEGGIAVGVELIALVGRMGVLPEVASGITVDVGADTRGIVQAMVVVRSRTTARATQLPCRRVGDIQAYDRKQREREMTCLKKKAARLGFDLLPHDPATAVAQAAATA